MPPAQLNKPPPWLGMFERRDPHRERLVEQGHKHGDGAQVIVFGLGRYGARLLRKGRIWC